MVQIRHRHVVQSPVDFVGRHIIPDQMDLGVVNEIVHRAGNGFVQGLGEPSLSTRRCNEVSEGDFKAIGRQALASLA